MKMVGEFLVGIGITIIVAAGVVWAAGMFDDGTFNCQKRFYQMQATRRCMLEYPRCEITTQDIETGMHNADYYERNCYDYEQSRPKPQPKAEPKKQSFKTEAKLNESDHTDNGRNIPVQGWKVI